MDPDRYRIQPKMLDPDPDQMNADPQPCLQHKKFFLFLLEVGGGVGLGSEIIWISWVLDQNFAIMTKKS
jgi:hypothetical protein